MKWILLPGLGADHRLFANISDLLPELQIVAYDDPEPGERLEQYAERLSRGFEIDGPFVLGGTSFGGMLSAILCARLQPVCLVLMCSTPTPAALGQSVRVFEWMSRVLPDTLATWVRQLGSRPMRWLEPIPPEHLEHFKAMVRDARLNVVRRGGRMIMEWQDRPEITAPLFHLHGTHDVLIPIRKVQPTHAVPGAGHLLNITHPRHVRSFIEDVTHSVG